MNEDKLMNQSQLAESVAEKIPYTFHDCFLVKPLDKIMVKKEVTELPNNKPVKDKDGIEAVEGTPKTEVKEVESDYQQGVVIKIPSTYKETDNKLMSVKSEILSYTNLQEQCRSIYLKIVDLYDISILLL